MVKSDTLGWHVFAPLPVSVRLNYTDPTGNHALTPLAVRERYRDEVPNSALIVWRDTKLGACGLRAGIDEVAWELASIEGFEIYFQKPAKGSGNVALLVRIKDKPAECVITASHFDDMLLAWFRRLGLLLSEVIPCSLKELDAGYDA